MRSLAVGDLSLAGHHTYNILGETLDSITLTVLYYCLTHFVCVLSSINGLGCPMSKVS